MIISRTTEREADAKYEVGDIVIYIGYLESAEDVGEQLICNRIVGTENSGDSVLYQLKGDNPETQKIDSVANTSIVAKFYTDDYKGSVLKGWGSFYDFITSQTGFLLPMIIFFLYAMIRVVISAMNYKKGKADEAKEDAEKEKQAAVDAAVAAALAEKNNKEDAKPADASADMTPEQMEQFKQFLAFQKAQQATAAPAEAAAPDEATAENSAETPDNTETTSEE